MSTEVQNLWYLNFTLLLIIPLFLLGCLHFYFDAFSLSEIIVVASLLILFLAGFYLVFFVRGIKPSLAGSVKEIDEGEQLANLWAEFALGLGSVTAVMATLYVGLIEESARTAPAASLTCLNLIRDYVAPPPHLQGFVPKDPELLRKELRDGCSGMQ